MKVVVLNDPYFPHQRLQIRFSGRILQHLEMDDSIPEPTVGMQFGIVCKLDRSFRSHAQYGVICEVLEFEYDTASAPDATAGESNPRGYVHVKATGKDRFKIDKVLHRGLDGLILTCEVTTSPESGTLTDLKLSETD